MDEDDDLIGYDLDEFEKARLRMALIEEYKTAKHLTERVMLLDAMPPITDEIQ